LIEERIALPCSGMNSVPSGFRLSLSYEVETTRNKMEDYKRRALEIPGRSAAKERSIKTQHHLLFQPQPLGLRYALRAVKAYL
jgi:hypothetical protein